MLIKFLTPIRFKTATDSTLLFAFLTCDLCGAVLQGDPWSTGARGVVCPACAEVYRDAVVYDLDPDFGA